LLAVVGPTGTGKTALAIHLAHALDAELIGCDALQVYRGFDVATAKPTSAERAAVPHHLVDVQDPGNDFTLARFVALAERCIRETRRRGRQPILVGGTGMYLRGLLRGIVHAPEVDARLRERLKAIRARRGDPAMHRWLARIDPASAERLAPADAQRVNRALEWWITSGVRWSDHLAETGTWEGRRERFRCLKIGLDGERDWLWARLEARVEGFFAAGLVEEVRSLLAAGISPDRNAFKAIGYREVVEAVRSGGPTEDLVQRVQFATRRYARRQRKWFLREPDIVWLDASVGAEELTRQALAAWERFCGTDPN
jgi:tRNA dimethylallyltransferase